MHDRQQEYRGLGRYCAAAYKADRLDSETGGGIWCNSKANETIGRLPITSPKPPASPAERSDRRLQQRA
jgi:hypothetical protein